MRVVSSLLSLLLAIGLTVPVGVAAAERTDAKVVVIVGPVGELTGRYLARGEAAAREAERFSSNVVRVFTPKATWPVVRDALDGAAIVVYLGHGNGWPSKYRPELFPPTQNGFGLNPVAGSGNDAHQYFGEGRIAADVRLAPNAVVLLHHLCYASGNTEPGLPEGTLDEAQQRVDNYAAGFIASGAAAVVAEGHLSPAWYVRQILAGNRTVESIWQSAPSRNGNTMSFDSRRSPGFVAAMDPDRPDGGYYRSIVTRPGSRLGSVGSGPETAASPVTEPTLVGRGWSMETPYLKGRPIVGATSEVWIPYQAAAGARRPAPGLTIGAMWEPLDPLPTPEGEAISLVAPERPASIVQPEAVAVGQTRLRVPIAFPDQAGRYRLVLTLHDDSGVAYDAASQDLVPGLIVRVGGKLDAAWSVPVSVSVAAGSETTLAVTVANTGVDRWGGPDASRVLRRRGTVPTSTVTGHWVDLDGGDEGLPRAVRAPLGGGLDAGATATLELAVTAPTRPGAYLLLLDVRIPGRGSLAANGVEPYLVRVTVE